LLPAPSSKGRNGLLRSKGLSGGIFRRIE
jgi:hypothetical protein